MLLKEKQYVKIDSRNNVLGFSVNLYLASHIYDIHVELNFLLQKENLFLCRIFDRDTVVKRSSKFNQFP